MKDMFFLISYAKLSIAVSCWAMVLMLTGCASLSKEECLNANWYSIGFSDGVNGYKANRQNRHRKTCAEYNVSLDLDDYLSGRERGLMKYCVPYNAYKTGLRGYAYNDVCPSTLAPSFYDAYRDGRELHLKNVRLDKKRARHKVLHNKIHNLHDAIDKKHQLLGDRSKSKEERRLIKKEIKLLKHEIRLDERQFEQLDRRIRELHLDIRGHQSDAQDRWQGH